MEDSGQIIGGVRALFCKSAGFKVSPAVHVKKCGIKGHARANRDKSLRWLSRMVIHLRSPLN